MRSNAALRVLVIHGYFDLLTPYFAAEYAVIQMGLDPIISESGVDPREVIGTLASHMRADMTDFFDGDYLPEVIGIAAQRGLGHLIKRIKIRRWVEGKGVNAKKVEEIDFEIARDNPAAVQLSKILRLDHVPHVKST